MEAFATRCIKMLTLLVLVCTVCYSKERRMKNFCYFTNWSDTIGAEEVRFQLRDIDPSLCSHLIYAFAAINTGTMTLQKTQTTDDNGKLDGRAGRYFEFTGLKKDNPGLVTLLSVGGANAGSKGFIQVVQSIENMELFARNVVTYLRDRDFDGIDIDWEYPTSIYRHKFTLLIKTLRREFDRESEDGVGKERLLLTIAAAIGSQNLGSYNITQISKYVDYIHLMSYDFHGYHSTLTSFSDPLYSRTSNPMFSTELSQEWVVRKWLEEGAPPSKLILGITATALTFVLDNSTLHDVGAPAKEGPKGRYLKQAGHCPYYHVCAVLERDGTHQRWDNEQKMAYAYTDTDWYGYNSVRSLQEKVQFASRKNLAGTMFWSLDLDDFGGVYCRAGKYPLLTAISDALSDPDNTMAPGEKTGSAGVTAPTRPFQPITNKNGINYYNIRGSASTSTLCIEALLLTLVVTARNFLKV